MRRIADRTMGWLARFLVRVFFRSVGASTATTCRGRLPACDEGHVGPLWVPPRAGGRGVASSGRGVGPPGGRPHPRWLLAAALHQTAHAPHGPGDRRARMGGLQPRVPPCRPPRRRLARDLRRRSGRPRCAGRGRGSRPPAHRHLRPFGRRPPRAVGGREPVQRGCVSGPTRCGTRPYGDLARRRRRPGGSGPAPHRGRRGGRPHGRGPRRGPPSLRPRLSRPARAVRHPTAPPARPRRHDGAACSQQGLRRPRAHPGRSRPLRAPPRGRAH